MDRMRRIDPTVVVVRSTAAPELVADRLRRNVRAALIAKRIQGKTCSSAPTRY
jgi:hypothetical protein